MRHLIFVIATMWLAACAGPNPNPGERTVDVAWDKYEYQRMLEVLLPAAKRGEPWAQLRMGIIRELGVGVGKDLEKAIEWYLLAAAHEAEGGWANGIIVGHSGRPGYFNQNNDALIAKYQLANLYLSNPQLAPDDERALELAENVFEKSEGKDIFYCCEFSGGRWIQQTAITSLLEQAREAAKK